MAVLLETNIGDLVLDLYVKESSEAVENFTKLCKAKFYNNFVFSTVEKDFVATGGDAYFQCDLMSKDRTLKDKFAHLSTVDIFCITQPKLAANMSVYGLIEMYQKKQEVKSEQPFSPFVTVPNPNPHLKHNRIGTVAMENLAPPGSGLFAVGSKFYISLRPNIEFLDGKHIIIGRISEGIELLSSKINPAFVDDHHCPLQNIRLLHIIVLEDPFPDPPGFEALLVCDSPIPVVDEDYVPFEKAEDEVVLLDSIAEKEAKSRAVTLEILGDLPSADLAPPDKVLFICKLNPVTQDDDLRTIFSRFGEIKSCDIIRDWKTGDSLQYGFIEFQERKSCENAYFKMKDVIVDDRRIHVDFCQSASKEWKHFIKNRAGDFSEIDVNQYKASVGQNSRDKRNNQNQDKGKINPVHEHQRHFSNNKNSTNTDFSFVFDHTEGLDNNPSRSQKSYDYNDKSHHNKKRKHERYRSRSRSRSRDRRHDRKRR